MYRVAWGEQRVYFYDSEGQQKRLPAAWTDVLEPEPFVVVSAGRSLYRLSDLIELRRLVDALEDPTDPLAPDDV
jgi:hypothetical protein